MGMVRSVGKRNRYFVLHTQIFVVQNKDIWKLRKNLPKSLGHRKKFLTVFFEKSEFSDGHYFSISLGFNLF